MSMAAPTPWTTRKAMRESRDQAIPQAPEASHQRLHLVEAVGQRIVVHAAAAGEARAADVLHAWGAHLHDAAQRVVRQFLVGPGAHRGLEEGLVGIGRRGLVLGAADDDAGVGLLDHAHHHVRVLVLRGQRTVALGVGVGRDVEHVIGHHGLDVAVDVLGEARVDLGQDVAAVVQRPHLADGLVAHAGDHAADVLHHGVHGGQLVVPVLLLARRTVQDGVRLAAVPVGHAIGVGGIVGHVVHARPDVHDGLEGGVRGHVGDPLAVDPDFPPVAQPFAVLLSRTNHHPLR